MNYPRLYQGLCKYGRDKLFAYVCDSFRPRLRDDPKYRQWNRLLARVMLKAMTPAERDILQSMLAIRMFRVAVLANPSNETQLAQSLCGNPQQPCRRNRTCSS